MTANKGIQRVVNKLDRSDILESLTNLPLSDLNTLLLEVYRTKSNHISHGELLNKYSTNRFVLPSEYNPIVQKQMEIDILKIAQSSSYEAIQLSPVAPLGCCSVVATVDQNKIISALRGTEVVSDATNLIALHICDLIKTGKLKNNENFIRFCTTHRHVRAQKFDKPGLLPHFNLFCMVTSGRDIGSYGFEKQSLSEHLKVYQSFFITLFNTNMKVRLTRLDGYTDNEGFIQRLHDHIRKELPEIDVFENTNKGENEYYKGLQFTIFVNIKGQEIMIGDGGFVDWSQKLLGNKKERMMISAIGLERLMSYVGTK